MTCKEMDRPSRVSLSRAIGTSRDRGLAPGDMETLEAGTGARQGGTKREQPTLYKSNGTIERFRLIRDSQWVVTWRVSRRQHVSELEQRKLCEWKIADSGFVTYQLISFSRLDSEPSSAQLPAGLLGSTMWPQPMSNAIFANQTDRRRVLFTNSE